MRFMNGKIIKSRLLTGVIVILVFCSPIVNAQTTWLRRGTDSTKYEMRIEKDMLYNGKPVMTIKSTEEDIEGFGTYMQVILPGKYLGKRVRMTGNMKSNNVDRWAGFWFRVDQKFPQKILAFDNMEDRAVTGTTDWGKYEIVLDVPDNATGVYFGALINGTGQIWFDDLVLEIVPGTVPTTGRDMN
jgi:hypothetical protein